MNVTSIIAIVIGIAISLLLPIGGFLYFKKKEGLELKPFFTGMIIFFVFALILEQIPHYFVIGSNLVDNPIAFTIYGSLAAGIFEEVGRFFAFKTVLKDKHEWKDGIAYGMGHGGIEAILLCALPNIIYIINNCLINSGAVETEASPFIYLCGGIERIFAFGIQIGLSMVVLYAVRYRKNIFLLFAILLHALVDVPACLYQKQVIQSLSAIEILAGVCFVISMIFLFNSKKIFSKEPKDASSDV